MGITIFINIHEEYARTITHIIVPISRKSIALNITTQIIAATGTIILNVSISIAIVFS